jgi:hypothetical protein
VRQTKDRAPLDRVRNVCGVGKAALTEIVGRADQREFFWIGETLEGDLGGFAHDAAAAVGANHPKSGESLGALGRFGLHGYTVGVLRDFGDAGGKPHLGMRQPLEHVVDEGRELVLLAMQAERIGGFVLEQCGELEDRDHSLGAVAQLPGGNDNADLQQLRGDAAGLKDFKRRRMKRSRPQIHEQVRMSLEHQNRNVLLGER